MATTELIIFVHIAKTGGTTLRAILDKQYGLNSLFMYSNKTIGYLDNNVQIINMLRDNIDTAKCISGHFGFGMTFYEINTTPLLPLIQTHRLVTYISMLRKPVDRTFSLYHHYKRNNWLHNDVTFESFIKHRLYDLNQQTKYISNSPEPNLENAKENIINHFAFVGVTDMYKESLFLMKQRFDWENFKYNKLGKFIEHSSRESISNEFIQIINNDNKLDLNLYNFAKQRLKKKIKLLDTSQKEALFSFSPFYPD